MENILETRLLEYENSTFLIDIARYNGGKKYIKIIQTIQGKTDALQQEIKINPAFLDDILKVLLLYQELIIGSQKVTKKTRTSDVDEIIKRYLKGVPIPDLTIQFNTTKKIIIQILNNNDIPIVDNKLPRYYRIKKKPVNNTSQKKRK